MPQLTVRDIEELIAIGVVALVIVAILGMVINIAFGGENGAGPE